MNENVYLECNNCGNIFSFFDEEATDLLELNRVLKKVQKNHLYTKRTNMPRILTANAKCCDNPQLYRILNPEIYFKCKSEVTI